MSTFRTTIISAVTIAVAVSLGACSDRKSEGGGENMVRIDGSSTVFPITQAVAEEFQKDSDVKVTIGVSGTGGGFKKFCRHETEVTGASRPVKEAEREACKSAGIDFIELPVAYDGIAVVVHPDNDWVDGMTVEELNKLWGPEAQGNVTKWSQIREGWPDENIHLFGPGVDSGTFDYFTKAINGREQASRGDFTASEDDNVLVQGVSTDKYALGFFGYAYYGENTGKLKIVPIDDGDEDNGAGAVAPSPETVANGTYQPLSRPIFVYVNAASAKMAGVKSFVEFYLDEGPALVSEVGYIALPDKAYEAVKKRFAEGTTGSLYEGGSKVGVSVEELLTRGADS